MHLWSGSTTSSRPAWAASKLLSKINTRSSLERAGRRGNRAYIALLTLLLSSFVFSSCARNFVTKRRQVKFISQKTEIEFAKKAKPEIFKKNGIYNNLNCQIYLAHAG